MTAVVTGASSGIGRAFAIELSRAGHALVIVARRADRLAELARELGNAEVLEADLAHDGDQERVAAAAANADVVVNAAGFGTSGKFAESDVSKQLAMLNVHAAAVVRICRAALPAMIARGRGDIINVASIGAFLPTSENATYCATKAFVVMFTRALAMETRGTGVRLQALCPGFTHTEFHATEEYRDHDMNIVPSALWMTPDDVARASLEHLGRRVVFIPRLRNRALVAVGRLVPASGWLVNRAKR